jgi:hypothetical protein
MKVNQQKVIELSFPASGSNPEEAMTHTVRLDSRFDSGNLGSAAFDLEDPFKVGIIQKDHHLL